MKLLNLAGITLLILVSTQVDAQSELCFVPNLRIQSTLKPRPKYKPDKPKTKPIMYNSLGYQFVPQFADHIIGGNSVSYKRWGFNLSYKIGIRNFFMPDGDRGQITYDNVIANNTIWTITDKTQHSCVGMIGGGITIPITKRMPFYAGVGTSYFREFFQYKDAFENKYYWNENTHLSGFKLNYIGGIYIPIVGRLLLNIEYDHMPQSVFIGIVIRERFAYDDIDQW